MSSEARDGAPAPDVAIRARGLTKSYHVYRSPRDRLKQLVWGERRRFYREVVAVREMDLAIPRGETVGVVGRNGAGKSTLLRLICGTLRPSGGEVTVSGHLAPLLTLGAGFNPEFSGRENVYLNGALLGLSEAEIGARLDAIRDFAEIGAFFDDPVKSYSSGMQARLAFAVAIHVDPEILVIDEILAVGDEAFTRKCFARIERIKRNGSTILFASHSAGSVVALCDRAVLMEAGERLLTADPKTVISRYQKLIHAPPERVAGIAAEIRALDAGGAARPAAPSRAPAPAATDAEAPAAPEGAGDGDGHFDPQLAPRSTLHFAERGARIGDLAVLDAAGRRVNVLQPGKSYVFEYEALFVEAARAVRFGMMVKLITGLDLGGRVSHLPGDGLDLEPGSRVRVRFPFRAALTPGAYFLNAGILGLRGGREVYLHRILDAAMFRVEPGGPTRITGRVDLSAGQPEWSLLSPEA